MLEIDGLTAGYGPTSVLHEVSMRVEPGQVLAVIGANGAGKSTLLRTVSGLTDVTSGRVRVDGVDVTRSAANRIVKRGVTHVPEGRHVFPQLTCLENLQLGGYVRRYSAAEFGKRLAAVLGYFPDLEPRLAQVAGGLSGGQQQMLAIARALMSDGKYLLLDEPSLGLAPLVFRDMFERVRQLTDTGRGLLLVEQNGVAALKIADHAVVLEQGRVVLAGTAEEIGSDSTVIERYLGTGAEQRGTQRQVAQELTAALRRLRTGNQTHPPAAEPSEWLSGTAKA